MTEHKERKLFMHKSIGSENLERLAVIAST